jgi:hypothetical protein
VDRGRVESLIGSDTVAAVRWGELERTVRPVLVVVGGVDTRDSVEVSASEDEDAIEAVAAEVRTQRSANAFALVARTGVQVNPIPSVRKTSSKARLNFVSRS